MRLKATTRKPETAPPRRDTLMASASVFCAAAACAQKERGEEGIAGNRRVEGLPQEGERRPVAGEAQDFGPPAAQKVVISGDALFANSIGRTDFPGSSLKQLLDNIREHLLKLPDDTVVLPGHGPNTTIGHEKRENPYVGEPAGYRV